MSNTQNRPIFGVLYLPASILDLGWPSFADLRQSGRLDGLMANPAIKIRGFGKKLGRKFIRFLKSEGPLQDDS